MWGLRIWRRCERGLRRGGARTAAARRPPRPARRRAGLGMPRGRSPRRAQLTLTSTLEHTVRIRIAGLPAGSPACPADGEARRRPAWSGPDAGDDDAGHGELDGGEHQARWVEGHLGHVLAELARGQQVEHQEGDPLQHHAEQAEDDGVEQRLAEPARRVGPDGAEDDQSLGEEPGGEHDAGVDRPLLVDVPAEVTRGEQVEHEEAESQQHDADPGVGDGVADAGQHGEPPGDAGRADAGRVYRTGLAGPPRRVPTRLPPQRARTTSTRSKPSSLVGGTNRAAVPYRPAGGTRARPSRASLRAAQTGTGVSTQTARTPTPAARAAATSGARSSGAGLVLSTTTLRPSANSSATTRRCRASRRRALGQWSLLTTAWVVARCSRTHVDFPLPCRPAITTSSCPGRPPCRGPPRPRGGGLDLVGAGAPAGVDHDLDTVALHRVLQTSCRARCPTW